MAEVLDYTVRRAEIRGDFFETRARCAMVAADLALIILKTRVSITDSQDLLAKPTSCWPAGANPAS
jgi:hypothetical protein